ncbi:MAG: outer membrane lipoprotein carrier protein LolA [Syntrophorhabdaceae bacterium]|nr:outer membrane lipoprotein carrier protein LolA [Syntrophorhabdaceae bacterium]
MDKRKSQSIFLWVAILFFWFSGIVYCVETSSFDDIKKTYSTIMTLEAGFSQKVFISSLKKEREFEGDFFYKRNKGFLWRYNKPKIRYFLYDGRFIWQGEEDKPVVYKRRVNKDKTGGTFLDLIDDISKMDELFRLKEKKRVGDMDIMELIPKKEGQVVLARVWVDRQNMVKRIEIEEFTGNINTISFTYARINEPVGDSRFTYRHEKGKEIVDTPN